MPLKFDGFTASLVHDFSTLLWVMAVSSVDGGLFLSKIRTNTQIFNSRNHFSGYYLVYYYYY